MCMPVLIGAVVAGTAMQAYGQFQSNMAGRRANEANDRTGRRMAEDATQRGEFAQAQHYQGVARAQGTQRAALAASGVNVGGGSALDILTDTGSLGELDARIIRSNAEREAYGYRAQNTGFSPPSPFMGVGATLLGGAAKVGDYWLAKRSPGGSGVGAYGGSSASGRK